MTLATRIDSLERRARITSGNIVILIERVGEDGADTEKAIVMSKGDAPGTSRVICRENNESESVFLARVDAS